MSVLRWAAALIVSVALIGGCQTTHKEETPAPMPASPDRVEMLKAKYMAAGATIGIVKSVNAGISAAAVEGIDVKATADKDVFHFIDPASDTIINNGNRFQAEATPSGYLVVKYDVQGQRAPQEGDLVVRLK